MSKKCSKCGIQQAYTNFYPDDKGSHGYSSHCKYCKSGYSKLESTKLRNRDRMRLIDTQATPEKKLIKKAKNKEWTLSNKDKLRNSHLTYHYGMSLAEYDRMLAQQGHRCAICPNTPTEKQSLAVDHCHITLKIRGLLCASCNNGLGRFRDSFDNLLNAAKYIQIHTNSI